MKRLLLCVALLLVAAVATAQVTTSAIRGHVTANNNSLPGATIVVRHLPSGTEYGTTTSSEGTYNLRGLRVGGPYTITISFIGYRSVVFTDVELGLGNTSTFDATLEETALQLDDVVIVAQVDNTVGNMTFSRQSMERIPSVDRSIYDLTNLMSGAVSPGAGGIVLAGQSTRYNAFTIDGTSAADIYGLGTTGMTGSLTNANPIPIDALAMVELSSSPIDLRESGFTGGGINAVTRSGDNTFSGSAYTYFNNEHFYGTTPGRDVENRTHLSEQMTSITGVTIGGPIVKDKLFFFLAGEFNRNIQPSTNHPGGVSALTVEEAQRISAHYKELTGYDGGGWEEHDILAITGSAVARLDWNINHSNRLSLRYNMLHADAAASSNSAQAFYFTGSEYTNINRTHSLVAELNSSGDWGMNTLRAGYTRLQDGRTTVESLPAVTINSLGERGNGSATIGTNPYSGCNMLSQDVFILGDDFTLSRGRHNITVGTSNEIYRADNLYLANARGSYTYATIDDFLADDGKSGSHATQYAYNYFVDGKRNPPMTMAQFALYAQDEVKLAQQLHLTYGLRVDMPVMFDTPVANEEFNNGYFATTYGTKTGDIPRTQLLFSPRVGIEWMHEGLTLRGSAGIYTGRIPFVWLANCYQNSGIRSAGVTVTNPTQTPAFNLNPETVGIKSNPSIDIVDEAFRYPQVFRVAATARYNIGDLTLQADADYTKGINNIFVENLVAEDKGKRLFVGGEGSSNSAIFYDSTTSDYAAVYRLSNTNRGYSWSATARLEYDFAKVVRGLEFMAAYTYTQSRSVNDGFSAQSSTNWGRTYTVNSNNEELSNSVYEFPHKVVATLSYARRYGLFGTNVMLLYNGYSGEHYSLTYARGKVDENGDTYRGNSLIYIPTKDEMSTMLWADETSAAAFNDYIEGDKYLKSHRGQFAERNSHSLPFQSRLDLHVAQSFYFDKKSSRRVEISLDVINLGNLLSRSWGLVHRTSSWALSPVTITSLEGVDGGYRPVYKFTGAEYTTDDIASRWHMQLGVRVVF